MKRHVKWLGMLAALAWSVAAAAEPPLYQITTRKADDRVDVKAGKDAVVIEVFSPGGIGGATITLAHGEWPHHVTLRLHLRGLESFTAIHGPLKLTGSFSSHGDGPNPVQLTAGGNERPLDPPVEILALDADGKPLKHLPGKDGCFEIRLPKPFLTPDPNHLQLSWIDFYRG